MLSRFCFPAGFSPGSWRRDFSLAGSRRVQIYRWDSCRDRRREFFPGRIPPGMRATSEGSRRDPGECRESWRDPGEIPVPILQEFIIVLSLNHQICFLKSLSDSSGKQSAIFHLWSLYYLQQNIYLSNRPQVSMGYKLISHTECWQNTRRICKPRAAGEWFTNSSSVLPTSQVVYQLINHRILWSIAFIS